VFNEPTVFVLGAGASWHYGYPTGQALIPKVIARANDLAQFFGRGLGEVHFPSHVPTYIRRPEVPTNLSGSERWALAKSDAEKLSARLKAVNPTLIDFFLAQNQDLHDIGRLAIAMVIFDCERNYHLHHGNINHVEIHHRKVKQGLASGSPPQVQAFDDDWLRFVLHRLTANCPSSESLANSDVTFITFNYDVSLEKRLFDGLSNISFFKEEDVAKFFEHQRVIHMYGKVTERVDRSWKPTEINLGAPLAEACPQLNFLFEASKGIRTIDGPDKLKDQKEIDQAKKQLMLAKNIYILGFGFDTANIERLEIQKIYPRSGLDRWVYFTNYGNLNRVSRSAGRAFNASSQIFIDRTEPYTDAMAVNGNRVEVIYEMSAKDVYGALSEDFDL